MAGHLKDIAERVYAAMKAGAEMEVAARELLDAIGERERRAHFTLTGDLALSIRPGWKGSSLARASDFVELSDELN